MILAVTDTHPLIWFVGNQRGKLGPKALEVFEGAEQQDGSALIYVPTIVLVECLGLFESERVRTELRFDEWVEQLENHRYFTITELRSSTILKSFELPQIRDPFDRMIIATALDLGLPLISSDTKIDDSEYVDLLWD